MSFRSDHGGASRIVLAILGVLFLLVVAAGAGAAWLYGVVGGPTGSSVAVSVTVPKGAGTSEIAELLASKGVITNADRFRFTAKRLNAGGELMAGTYDLSTNMPDDLVIERLMQGPKVKTFTVTIPEGFNITQTAKRWEDRAGVPADEFEKLASSGAGKFAADHPYLKHAYRNSLEGFLFPKTYTVKEGTTAEQAIELQLDQFDKEIQGVDTERAAKTGVDMNELVTVASIIEREAAVSKERPLVASVIYNRLNQNMRLQMCSTVVYVLGRHELRLTNAETRTESPYNTYLHQGLPPGPIASPGLDSLKAATKPADTTYLYYVLTDPNGSHTFATTMAQFEAAKRKSKEVFGK